MAAIGRILQVIGWLWFITGILGPIFEFQSVNPFPGLFLIFIARIFRARARSDMPPAPGDDETTPQATPVEAPRTQPRQEISPPAERVEARPAGEPKAEPKPERPVDERNQLLERIAMAGREAADEPAAPEPEKQSAAPSNEESKAADVTRTPMSSAEMIARARNRWDSNKR